MKILVVMPTYNERENVANMVPAVLSALPDAHILIVDDSSPDGTAEVVKEMQKENPQLHLLLRKKKEGLGRAYVAGFQWGIVNGFDGLIEMDADFSHRPQDLTKIVEGLRRPDVDFVVGSRYVNGGGVTAWSLGRKAISRGGSLYARLILGFPINDWTGGFNAYKKNVLQKIGMENIRSNGYSFQIELKYRSLKAGFRGQEVPIQFAERAAGKSKMSAKIVLEALLKVWVIRFA